MSLQNEILLTNIQRFSLHDGPGIRTTVFLKGCSLHCPWCANPENISSEIQYFFDGINKSYYGKILSLQQIYEELSKDKKFYLNGGGVTFSGGEPLLQIKKLERLLEKLKEENISICVETALFVDVEYLKIAVKYIDTFIVDIKILDKDNCKTILGGNVEAYKNNFKYLIEHNTNIIVRLPLIKPYTTNKNNIEEIISFCKQNRIEYVELIKGHNLAEKKYKSLNMAMYEAPDIADSELEKIQSNFNNSCILTKLCKI